MQLLFLLLFMVAAADHTPHGSKAPYSFVAGDIRQHQFPCQPVSMFSVHRHGSRNIGKNVIKRINLLVGALQSRYREQGLHDSNLSWILEFRHQHKPNKDLVLEGYQQLFDQGQRFKAALPGIFTSDPSSSSSASSSFKGRCISSALSFLAGVYGNDFAIDNTTDVLRAPDIRRHCEGMCHVYEPLTNSSEGKTHLRFDPHQNHLLRYYKDCKNYVLKEDNKIVWQAAPNEYFKHYKMRNLVTRMGERLGVVISPHDVVTLHMLCSLELALPRLHTNSQWCSLFQEDELYTTAYYLDLLRYAGKVIQEAVDASCVLWQDGLDFLKNSRGFNLKFGHTETIFPLLFHIGLLSEPMVQGVHRKDRQFFGDITPLGGNLAIVGMQCPGEPGLIVEAFLNENHVEMPNCEAPCKLETLLEQFPADGCDFVKICEGSGSWWSEITLERVAGALVMICLADLIRRCLKR